MGRDQHRHLRLARSDAGPTQPCHCNAWRTSGETQSGPGTASLESYVFRYKYNFMIRKFISRVSSSCRVIIGCILSMPHPHRLCICVGPHSAGYATSPRGTGARPRALPFGQAGHSSLPAARADRDDHCHQHRPHPLPDRASRDRPQVPRLGRRHCRRDPALPHRHASAEEFWDIHRCSSLLHLAAHAGCGIARRPAHAVALRRRRWPHQHRHPLPAARPGRGAADILVAAAGSHPAIQPQCAFMARFRTEDPA